VIAAARVRHSAWVRLVEGEATRDILHGRREVSRTRGGCSLT
jgi:hypothetical protein